MATSAAAAAVAAAAHNTRVRRGADRLDTAPGYGYLVGVR